MVMGLRLPRIVLGIFIGAALAVAGATLQGLFRNPLADPALIGVSSGAALAAVGFIVLGQGIAMTVPMPFASYLLPVFAFFGGLIAVLLVYRIGTVNGRSLVLTMLLAGIAINAICNALMGLLIFVSDDQQLRDLTFWTMGSLSRNTWRLVLPLLPFLLIPLIGLPLLARAMNAYVLGESEAGHLGYDIERLKKSCDPVDDPRHRRGGGPDGDYRFCRAGRTPPGTVVDGRGPPLPVPGIDSAGRNTDTCCRYNFQDDRCARRTAYRRCDKLHRRPVLYLAVDE